jgi:hypothetical protein
MSTVLRRNRKGSDADIIRLNSVGFSLATIAKMLTCHPTSISLRLSSLKIPPSDTRHAFMETIFKELPSGYQDLVADRLQSGTELTIKDYVKNLIVQDMGPVAVPDEETPTEGDETVC